jgi:hypothetical protein
MTKTHELTFSFSTEGLEELVIPEKMDDDLKLFYMYLEECIVNKNGYVFLQDGEDIYLCPENEAHLSRYGRSVKYFSSSLPQPKTETANIYAGVMLQAMGLLKEFRRIKEDEKQPLSFAKSRRESCSCGCHKMFTVYNMIPQFICEFTPEMHQLVAVLKQERGEALAKRRDE